MPHVCVVSKLRESVAVPPLPFAAAAPVHWHPRFSVCLADQLAVAGDEKKVRCDVKLQKYASTTRASYMYQLGISTTQRGQSSSRKGKRPGQEDERDSREEAQG